MNQNNRLSIDGDSLETSGRESELDKLRTEVKQKQFIIDEKSQIINSLRQQVNDMQHDVEELETNEQFLNQKLDRITKEKNETAEELESVSAAMKEIEHANEMLSKRMEARTVQIQKFVEDLTKAKKDLEEARIKNEELQHKNEHLNIELEMAKSRRKPSRDEDENDGLTMSKEVLRLKDELETAEQSWQIEKQHKERYARENIILDRKLCKMHEELTNMNKKYADLESKCARLEVKLNDESRTLSHHVETNSLIRSHSPVTHRHNATMNITQHHQLHSTEHNSRTSQRLPSKTTTYDENMPNFNATMRYPMEDELGEIMESSSRLATNTNAAIREKRLHSESQAWEQQYDSYLSKRAAQQQHQNHEQQVSQSPQQPMQQQKQSLSVARNNYCTNHRIQKSQFFEIDPIAEQKMRIERANELARRNMQTKPLHQTSYPLELDTFDTTSLTETEIKRGNVPRQALANFSNQQNVVGQHHQNQKASLQYQQKSLAAQPPLPPPAPIQRRPVKKAEAFIV